MAEGLASLRVLLIDDNKHMRAIVGAILHGLGVHTLKEAADGKEAIDILRQWPADLAICDFAMKPMDGVEFTRLVRNSKISRNPYLPIIMMTGHADKGRVFEARDAGVTELLVKPVTARDVIDRLNTVIYRPRPFVRTPDYFGPLRRGLDDEKQARLVPQAVAEI